MARHAPGTVGTRAAYYGTTGSATVRYRAAGAAGSVQIEIYRVVHWVGIAALVVWTVYSAYFAIGLS
jgi:hypothetical protein